MLNKKYFNLGFLLFEILSQEPLAKTKLKHLEGPFFNDERIDIFLLLKQSWKSLRVRTVFVSCLKIT